MKKKIMILFLAIIVLFLAVVVWWFVPTKMLANDVDEISYIEVGDGSTGKQFAITDEDDINSIIEMLQSISIRKKELNGERSGFSYTIELYSKDGSLYKEFTLLSERSIVNGAFVYHAQGNAIDFTVLKQLEMELAS